MAKITMIDNGGGERPGAAKHSTDEGAGRSRPARSLASRRNFLRAAGVAGVTGVLGGVAGAQEQVDTHYRLGGRVSGWQGREPESISGETNPTLSFEVGKTYEITWENLDGLEHELIIESESGEELAATESTSEEGATRSLTYEATGEAASYYCEYHPQSMRGDVEVSGETPSETPEEPAQRPGLVYFEEGPAVGLQKVADGRLAAPTDFAAVTVDGDERRFVTDQTGQVWEITDGGLSEEAFFSVRDEMVTLGEFAGTYASPTQQYDERGLLGIAFHPEFPDDRRMYLHYSVPRTDDMPEDWDHRERLAEFELTEDLSGVASDTQCVLMDIPHPQYNHDAGPIAFGPDGYLYFPMGDGGGANDDFYGHVEDWYPDNAGGNGQDIFDNVMGSVMRIDVDDPAGGDAYGVPDDNPLVGREGLDELYAWGFRNPFGIDFDSEGRMFVSDAGQNLWEEANIVEKGANYGWNVKEGTHCFSTEHPNEPADTCPNGPTSDEYPNDEFADPILEYPHTQDGETVGRVVVGGHFYENDTIPELQGHYVYGEYNSAAPDADGPVGRLLAAAPGDEGGLWSQVALKPEGSDDYGLDWYVRQFGQDEAGELYLLVNQNPSPWEGEDSADTGAVFKLVPSSDG